MNLKESFRYQNFLSRMIEQACSSITDRQHCLTIRKMHLCSKVNSASHDFVESVEPDDFPPNDKVIHLLFRLLEERGKLSESISAAKRSIDFDLDAAVETNKTRQKIVENMNLMLRFKEKKNTERGVGYKFNVDGDQTEYFYDVEVSAEEAFDRAAAKAEVRRLITEADKISSKIDAAMVNTEVQYTPAFDVNDTLEDII